MINKLVLFFFAGILIFLSCKRDEENPNPIPDVSVSETINMALPAYQSLINIGNWVYFTGGNRGLFIYHNLDDEFVAFDRNCSYQPLDECATLEVDTLGVFLQCGTLNTNDEWEPCCNSRFSFDGFPNSGPANINLRQYRVSRSGSVLFISN